MNANLTIGLLIGLVLVNYRLSHSILYPPFIFCTMWLMVMALYHLHLAKMDPIHLETFSIVSAGALLFSAGGVFALLVPRSLIEVRLVLFRDRFKQITRSRRQSGTVKYIMIFVLAIGICFLARHTFIAAAQGSGSSFLARARNAGIEAASEGEHQSPVFAYFLLWSIYASVLLQLEGRSRPFWLLTGIAFTGCIFSTGRTQLLLLVSALTCVHLIKTNRLSFGAAIKFARWPLLVFVLLWVGLIFTSKNISTFGLGVGELVLLFLVNYIVGPVVALDYALQHPADYLGMPHHTFKFFLGIAAFFHLIRYTPPPPYDSFVAVPFPTNVYTVYKFYITDFGIYGALGIIAIIGLLHTLLYLKARTGSELGIYFFALTIYPAVMVIFDDQYSAFGSYLDILLFGMLYIGLRSQPMFRLPEVRRRLQTAR